MPPAGASAAARRSASRPPRTPSCGNGGGYARKGVEAWFTFLIEHLWGKRRIMEVYLNVAETGIGTYGVNAGSQRYFGHDASAMSATEAARIAAILPLPKKRGAVAPKGFTRRYGNTIAARIGVVGRDGLDACVYKGATAPVNKAPPPVTKKARPLPGEEYETAKPLPPVENAVERAAAGLDRAAERRRAAARRADNQPKRPPPVETAAGAREQRLSRRAERCSRSALRDRNGAPPPTVESRKSRRRNPWPRVPKAVHRIAPAQHQLAATAAIAATRQPQRLLVGRQRRADASARRSPASRSASPPITAARR